MTKLDFNRAKRMVIEALLNGTFQHETSRSNIDTKNLLLMGLVGSIEISELLKRSNGRDHSASPHHQDGSIEVHVIQREGWYVKFYFLDPVTFFISVHQ